MRKAVVNISIGFQMGVTVTIFVFIGYWLDNKYDTTPICLTIGAAVGMVVGFYHLVRELTRVNKEDPDEENRKKTKWMSFF